MKRNRPDGNIAAAHAALRRPDIACAAFVAVTLVIATVLHWSILLSAGHPKSAQSRRLAKLAALRGIHEASGSNETLIVVIGNSQAYGPKVEPREIYTAQLENLLGQPPGPNVRVVNWSMPGAVGPEFLLLTAAARRLHPDWVICAAGAGSFASMFVERRGRPVGLDFFLSDARHLIALGDVRRALPPSFAANYLSTSVLADAWLARVWKPWTYRDWPLQQASAWNGMIAFLPARNRARWGQVAAAAADAEVRRDFVTSTTSEPLIRDFLSVLSASAPHTLLIRAPVRPGTFAASVKLTSTALSRWVENGGSYEDWSPKLPADDFMDSAHLTPAGHRAMAALLAERLAR